MNVADSELVEALLKREGYKPAPKLEDADAIFVNTCAIREHAEEKVHSQLGRYRKIKQRKRDVIIGVLGCMAQSLKHDLLENKPYVDIILGPDSYRKLPKILNRSQRDHSSQVDTTLSRFEVYDDLFPSRQEGINAWISIMRGCDKFCTFCIVPFTRGRERSRSVEGILAEVSQAVADGFVEVTLLGQNVNSYGRDLTTHLRTATPELADVQKVGSEWANDERRRARPLFADLLAAIGAVEGIQRVRFTSPHPKDLRTETISAMANTPTVCEHLHLPLQSGSDRVLAEMHRGYTADRYLRRVAEAKAGITDLAVTTDVIVGFPGESERDFTDTLEVAAEAGFDSAYTFIYSPRPGTEAAERQEEFVDHAVSVERFERLREVLIRSAALTHRNRVGKVEEVLVEGPAKRGNRLVTARTRQNKLVHLPARDGLRTGTYALARITDAATHYLYGEVIEVTAPPRHRRRIPVTVG